MRRKLISQGCGGSVIYVPKKWLDSHNLKPGDDIIITEEDNKLILTQEKLNTKKTAHLRIDREHSDYKSLIGSFYRVGYDEIKLKFNKPPIWKKIEKNLQSFYGLEIFDIADDSCTIRNIFSIEYTDLEMYLTKMIHIVNTIHSTIVEDIENNKFDNLSLIDELRINLLKQRYLIQRTILKDKLFDPANFSLYRISNYLWDIVRSYYYMYKVVNNIKKYKQLKETLLKVNSYFRLTFQNNATYDLKKCREEFDLIYSDLANKNNLYVPYLMSIIMSIESCNSDIYVRSYIQNKTNNI